VPGKTKKQYVKKRTIFNKSLKLPLSTIKSILPISYDEDDILLFFKELYPYEWDVINERYKLYQSKDCFLKNVGKKTRYKLIGPQYYLFELPKTKHILSQGQKNLHRDNFNEENRLIRLTKLRAKIKLRMSKINGKTALAKVNIQNIEPAYIDIYIHYYHKEATSIEDKIEIVKELQKYDCNKSLKFFQKLNDCERNAQIRSIAFNHLRKTGKYVILRKGFKGRKKKYMLEQTNFEMKPIDLFKKIKEDSIQNKKSYDLFISHSFKDNKLINSIREHLNKKDLHIYCDWLSDNDFLKRKGANQYTEAILKRRIEQSTKVLFIKTNNTNDKLNNFYSMWVEMEISYAKFIKKPIEYINFTDNNQKELQLSKYNEEIKELVNDNR